MVELSHQTSAGANAIGLLGFHQDPDALLDRVEAGEHVIVARGGRPIAELRLVPATQPGPRPFGLCAGAFVVPDDFDSPLPEEILRGFEGRQAMPAWKKPPQTRLSLSSLNLGDEILTDRGEKR